MVIPSGGGSIKKGKKQMFQFTKARNGEIGEFREEQGINRWKEYFNGFINF